MVELEAFSLSIDVSLDRLRAGKEAAALGGTLRTALNPSLPRRAETIGQNYLTEERPLNRLGSRSLRSTALFVALVGFAVLNTAFLGYHLYSGTPPVVTKAVASSTTQNAAMSTLSSAQSVLTQSSASVTTVASTLTPGSTEAQTQTTTVAGAAVSASSSVSNSTVIALVVGSQSTTAGITSATNSTGEGSSGGMGIVTNSTLTSSPSFGASVSLQTNSSAGAKALTTAVVAFFEDHSLILAPSSWFAVGGMWIWRGRMRSRWTNLGFDSDVFTLFVRMKGAKTRIRLLDALTVPKDRLQLADELGLDWKSVDRHIAVMKKYGFVTDKVAYGRVKLYELTPMGNSLLKLLQELSKEEKQDGLISPMVAEGES